MAKCIPNLLGYGSDICNDGIGGIKTVYLVEKQGLSGFDIVPGEITGLTLAADYTGYTYSFLKDNSEIKDPIVDGGRLANAHWTPQLTLVFRKMTTLLRNEAYALSRGVVCAIVQDQNDLYHFLGYQDGLEMASSAGGQSGLVFEDLNGYTLQFNGKEPTPSYTIDISSGSAVDARILAAFGF